MANQRHSGFTLIELMITLAILAILVAIAAPSFSGMLERRKLHGAGENLFADLTFAKTETIKQNANIRVTFIDSNSGATWCYGMAIDTGVDCDCTDNVPACTIEGVTKIVDQDDFPGVSVVTTSSFSNDFTAFDPLRGITKDAAGSFQNGTLEFSVTSGARLGVIVSRFGRIRLCGTSFNHDAC